MAKHRNGKFDPRGATLLGQGKFTPPTPEQVDGERRRQAAAGFRQHVLTVAARVASGLAVGSPCVSPGAQDEIARKSVALARRVVLRANATPYPEVAEFEAIAAELLDADIEAKADAPASEF